MAGRRNYLQTSKMESVIETVISKELSISGREREKKNGSIKKKNLLMYREKQGTRNETLQQPDQENRELSLKV